MSVVKITEGREDAGVGSADALFYHAFPRVKRSSFEPESVQLAKGLHVLESILTQGLLLTPEYLDIPPNPDSDAKSPPRTRITQRRACFTHLERSAFLRATVHRTTFGRFAIGLRTDEARSLGILPTFYYYRPEPAASHDASRLLLDGGLSEQILYRLAEIRRLLIAVARIEAKGTPERPFMKNDEYLSRHGLCIKDEAKVDKCIEALSTAEATRICQTLATERVPAWNLAEWIEIVLSVFQTADSHQSSRHLAYYAQREWRLAQVYVEGLMCIPLNKSQLAQDPMISEDLRQWARNCRSAIQRVPGAPKDSYLDDCYMLIGRSDRPFHDFIEDIVAPAIHDEQVESLLGDVGLLHKFKKQFAGTDVLFTRLRH